MDTYNLHSDKKAREEDDSDSQSLLADQDLEPNTKEYHMPYSQRSSSSRRSFRWTFLIPLFFACVLLLFVVVYANSPAKPVSCSCGSSIAEAKSKGCKYDELSSAWLPAACRDDENTAEFARQGDGPNGTWLYYSDWDKTSILSIDEVANLPETQGVFYTTHAWHVKHCVYSWRKLWRSRKTGVTVEPSADTENHLMHCGMMFLKRDPLDFVVTGSGVALNADARPLHGKGE